MSQTSFSPSEAEPPFDDQPVSPEEALTLDLAEPARSDVTLDDETNGVAAPDGSAQAAEPAPADEGEETLDLPLPAEETLVGCDLQQGKYRVLALRPGMLVGSSMLGASYMALHTDLQKRLTIRYLPLDPRASAEEHDQTTLQFLREVRVLAKLDHPSLPRVHDYFCEGAACYVVMDALAEHTLADVLAEAAQAGRVPALPPVAIAQLGLELVRVLGYLHQQRPPLALGGLRAEDIALPEDGPAQVVSLGALSMVALASSASLPGFASLPTLPVPAQIRRGDAAPPAAPQGRAPAASAASSPEAAETLAEAAPAPAAAPHDPPKPGDDLYSLGLLLRELAGGAGVVARVMDRLQRPEEALQADGADDAPPISLALASVIQIAAHSEPARRFQSAAAFETALMRAWMVERRILRQAERRRRDEHATRTENGEDDLAATSLDLEPSETRQHGELATRHFSLVGETAAEAETTACWRCGGHNAPDAPLCRVCGARQPTRAASAERGSLSEPRRRARTTRRLPPGALDDSAWAEWASDDTQDLPARPRRSRPASDRLTPEGTRTAPLPRRASTPLPRQHDSGRRLLWGLVWVCFIMAFLLGGATVVITYLALR
jgi:serine/threonine protein kinase/ribosomal protein L40E